MSDDEQAAFNPYEYAQTADETAARSAQARPTYVGLLCGLAISMAVLGVLRELLQTGGIFLAQQMRAPGAGGPTGSSLALLAINTVVHTGLCIGLALGALAAWRQREQGRRWLVRLSVAFAIYEVARLAIFLFPALDLQAGLSRVEDQMRKQFAKDPNASPEMVESLVSLTRYITLASFVLGGLYSLGLLAFYGTIVGYFRSRGVRCWFRPQSGSEDSDMLW